MDSSESPRTETNDPPLDMLLRIVQGLEKQVMAQVETEIAEHIEKIEKHTEGLDKVADSTKKQKENLL